MVRKLVLHITRELFTCMITLAIITAFDRNVVSTSKTDCKKDVLGQEYTGTLSRTSTGLKCQAWSSQTPHKHQMINYAVFIPERDLKAAKNYCRNPDAEPSGPWCYTIENKTRWEYCDLELCSVVKPNIRTSKVCKIEALGNGYDGTLSVTESGIRCQAWDSQSPHQHTMENKAGNFPEGDLYAANNYCRNPTLEADGPWCFTVNKTTRWEFCDVRLCTGPSTGTIIIIVIVCLIVLTAIIVISVIVKRRHSRGAVFRTGSNYVYQSESQSVTS